jgi:hypothetical protein
MLGERLPCLLERPGAGVEHYAGRTSASPAIAGPLMTLPARAAAA